MTLPNRFAALAVHQAETNSPSGMTNKKNERAAEHRSARRIDVLPSNSSCQLQHGLLPGQHGGGSASAAHQPPPPPPQQHSGGYRLEEAGDGLLVAVDAATGDRLAALSLGGPADGLDEDVLALVAAELAELAQQAQQEQRAHHHHRQQHEHEQQQQQHGCSGQEDDNVEELLSVLFGSGSGGASGIVDGEVVAPAAAGSGSQHHALGLPQWQPWPEEVAEAALEVQADWQLAAVLQEQEDAEGAAVEAEAAGEPLADWQLALRLQEEEDAAMAAALAAQEEQEVASQAARAAKEVAASSRSFWALRGRRGGSAPTAAGSRDDRSSSCGAAGEGAAAEDEEGAFPSLHAAASRPGSSSRSAAARGGAGLRAQLLQQHRSAKQRVLERGSGIRLLHQARLAGQRSAPGSPHSGLASDGSAAWRSVGGGGDGTAGGSGSYSGLPPLQLEGGLRLHEDDLDYQLLLKDDGVTAAARAAADSYAERADAAGSAASGEALRSMIDAAARSSSRPGSAAGGGAIETAGGSDCQTHGQVQRQQAQQGGGAADALDVHVEPVDTKSFRRIVEDMRRRGWHIMQAGGGGHIRCERIFPDLDPPSSTGSAGSSGGSGRAGYKQVYFLCSTPSDVAYIWNVAAAIKRFDREVLQMRRQQAAAAAEAAAAASQRQSSCGGGQQRQ